MSHVPLIPGPAFDPSPYAAQSPRRSSRLLRTVVIVWLLAGVGVLAFKFLPGTSQAGDIAHSAKDPNGAANTEDLVHHMDAVMARLSEAAANLRRAEDQVSRTLSVVDRNYLLVEKRRLENALFITESVRRDLEQGRKEAELVSNSLKKEHELK